MKNLFSKNMGFKRKRPSDEMSLQITSMADVFIILLVFLLKGYASGAVSLTPGGGTLLPEAQAAEAPIEALKVEISESAIQVEGRPVMMLQLFRLDPSETGRGGISAPLAKALANERQRQLLIAQTNSTVKVDPRIIIMADRRVPYSTIKSVLASAAVNGYTDFKLAVAKGD